MADKPKPRTPEQLRPDVERLLAAPLADAELRDRIEALALIEKAFPGLTALWGPILYRRNRAMFRPFILSRFGSGYELEWRWHRLPWDPSLDSWLAEVDEARDVDLFRKLWAWKNTKPKSWQPDRDAWQRELLERYRKADGRSARAHVLACYQQGLWLDEAAATELYGIDAASRPFLLAHLPRTWWSGAEKRRLWKTLHARALENGDAELAFSLYRRQVPIDDWRTDAVRLVNEVTDEQSLLEELGKRHPEGWDLDRGPTFLALLRRRGREVVPYVLGHLVDVGGYRGQGSVRELVELAEREGWLDLWGGLLRTCVDEKTFDAAVLKLVKDESLGAGDVKRRLLTLAGVGAERNFGAFGFARVSQLEDSTALALYDRFPDLLSGGPFQKHVSLGWRVYTKLLERAIDTGDEVLVDFLASRAVTRDWPPKEGVMTIADRLSRYYEAMEGRPEELARRAVAVLAQVPAYTVYRYDQVLEKNRLARLLFGRSAQALLTDSRGLRDLLEAPEIHVQALAFRTLGQDDERARTLAREHLDLLLATLLRPLHRKTRLLAFGALESAASTPDSARAVLSRAREAFDLPHKGYPKEKLLGLVARILRRYPELRGENEEPVVYGDAAA